MTALSAPEGPLPTAALAAPAPSAAAPLPCPLSPLVLDAMLQPALLLDSDGRLLHANPAALRLLPVAPGLPWRALMPMLAAPLNDWLARVWADATGWPPGQASHGPYAASATTLPVPVLNRLSPQHWLLCLPPEAVPGDDPVRAAADDTDAAVPTLALADGPLRQLYTMLWHAPFPATLQDESFRLIDVNPAYAQLVGLPRQQLIGHDPLALQPAEAQAAARLDRERLQREPRHPEVSALREETLLDANGRRLRVQAMRYRALTEDQRQLVLTLMQDTTAERSARDQADRYSREIDQWFDLSPLGMALLDVRGLVLRANGAFGRLLGTTLTHLHDAPPAVQALLHWNGTEMAPPLAEGAAWVSSDAVLPRADGRDRWVRALLNFPDRPGHPRRVLCMLEDRTAQEERDLAQLQLDALADTAGAGLATVAEMPAQLGWASGGPAGEGGHAPALAQGVRRDWVEPGSMAEYERLQQALLRGDRFEARYAILHPALGRRWLLSRVQPGRLASGRPSTSVVTLDITEQQLAHERSEQLLGELSTILESSPAGIASLQGCQLTHCNRRFERMLRLNAGAGAGADIRALLSPHVRGADGEAAAADLEAALGSGQLFEAELEVVGEEGVRNWFALSIRRTGPAGGAPQAIAVLSEITRLKMQQMQLESLAREREQMAQVLGQQADRTRAVLDSVLVGIVTVDPQGVVSWLNRSARRMFGGDLVDFLGLPLTAVATDDADHPFRRSAALFDQLLDGEALKFECRVRARDGRTFWVVGNAVATVNARATRELTFALMDIEQRRQAESRVAQARESLQRIIEAAPMAITLFDAQTLEVRQINRVAAEALGLSAEAAVGRTPASLYPPEHATRFRTDLLAALAAPEVVTEREHTFDLRGGHRVWDLRYLPLSQPADPAAGRPLARVDQILLVATDVTAQRAAQRAELEAAIAQREMLVQEVHHRIKNNLQGVAGLLQQIGQRRPEVQPVITEVVGQVQAIAQVYGLQVGGVGPLQLRDVVEAIAQSVARTFGREIVFSALGDWSLAWTLPESEAIPIALTLNELLTNAVKHSLDAAPVLCRVDSSGEGVLIEIDNAGRLASDFRIDHRPSTVSGLGLVRALLPRRHATLTITPRGDRVVAAVTLSPPVVRARAEPSRPYNPAGRPDA
jgi:PAS domain S-box-containing protein